MNDKGTRKDNTVSIMVYGNIPTYQSEWASGADLCAFLKEDIVLEPLKRVLIPTNTYIALPRGLEAQVRPRSGIAITHGITLINAVGTIDSDYRGEIKLPIINLGNVSYTIKNKERIAQLVISSYKRAEFLPVASFNTLSKTTRGKRGFGSTGKYM